MNARSPLGLVALLALAGCGNDRIVRQGYCPEVHTETTDETVTTTTTTTTQESSFDIEQVSVLEASELLLGGADAVILDHDASQLPPGATWRVGHVDVLVLVPSWAFNGYPGSLGLSSVGLTVQVWDAATPLDAQKPAYALSQVLNPAELTWAPVTLVEGTFMKAWWSFPFTDPGRPVITSPMSAQRYLVGVRWDGSGEPRLGYSNFNRPCDRNWTQPAGSPWQLNSSSGAGALCNWPMLRVGTEITTEVTKTEVVPVTREVTVLVERDECATPEADAGTP